MDTDYWALPRRPSAGCRSSPCSFDHGMNPTKGRAVEFLLLFAERRGMPLPEDGGPAEMKAYAEELRRRGILRRGGPLVEVGPGRSGLRPAS